MATPYFMTGALGCIGAWVVKALVERGDRPVVFDQSRDRRRLEAIVDPADLARITFLQGDVTDGAAVRSGSFTWPASRCPPAGPIRRGVDW
jgi:nucleoside-diphosphate-sugar epimerase